VLGEVLQECDEVGAVVLADSREQFCLVLVGDTLGTAEQVVGGAGEVDRVSTPIGGVAAAFDESSILEFVDEADHHVAVDAHGVCEPLLGLPLASREVHEQPEVTRPHAQRRQALGELMRAVRAELGQQEAGSAGQRVTSCPCRDVGHSTMLTPVIVIYDDNKLLAVAGRDDHG
jgi:hypothetical protein